MPPTRSKRPVARPKRKPPVGPHHLRWMLMGPSRQRLTGPSLASNIKGSGGINRVGAAHIQGSMTRTVNRIARKLGIKRGKDKLR